MKESSAAIDLVMSVPPSGASYLIAFDQMKAGIARRKSLIKVYVRELLNLVKQTMKASNLFTTQGIRDTWGN